MRTIIFDLDGTVINSSHRYKANEDGTVDLDHWRKYSTFEHIMQDQLMPLANHWKMSIKEGCRIVVCTARVMRFADYYYLRANGLHSDSIFSRQGEKDARSGAIQKLEQLSSLDLSEGTIFWEDCDKIREIISENLPIKCLHPDEY